MDPKTHDALEHTLPGECVSAADLLLPHPYLPAL